MDGEPIAHASQLMSDEGVLLSIHDVTPAHEGHVKQLWEFCLTNAVIPALLVVPDWHGRWPLQKHDAFVKWVRACAAEGAEIILHGERHDEVGLQRDWRDNLRALGRTAREGEFLTLQEDEAFERIKRGLSLFRDLGLQTGGFIPPAWLARQDTHDAVARAGLRFSEDDHGVLVHDGRRRAVHLRAPALRWSGRTLLRAYGSAVSARVRWLTQRHAPLVRIALHPQDLASRVTAKSVRAELTRWADERRTIRYDQLADHHVGHHTESGG